jgi:SRSO17 transposase
VWTRGLLIRRNISDGERAYFSTWCPAATSLETLVAVEGQRWSVEDGFETAKTELGLDHNETRSWHGWHRHVSLVMLGFAMLATIRHRANRGRKKHQRPTVRRQNHNHGPLVDARNSSHRHPPGATAY